MKKFSITIILIIVLFSLIISCNSTKEKNDNEPKEIKFTIGTAGIFCGSTSYGTLLINNHTLLKETFEDQSIQWEDGVPIWDRYSDDFFDQNALVMYTFGGSGDNVPEFEVERLVKEGNTLTIYIIQHGMTEGLMYYTVTILIEVNKFNMVNVENIETNTKLIFYPGGN